MTRPSRLDTLTAAQAGCEQLRRRHPQHQALASIQAQLAYLIALESGQSQDRSRLKDITIGVLTAREIEPLDDSVAELFYQAASQARFM